MYSCKTPYSFLTPFSVVAVWMVLELKSVSFLYVKGLLSSGLFPGALPGHPQPGTLLRASAEAPSPHTKLRVPSGVPAPCRPALGKMHLTDGFP